jgi:hypothetical protein
VTDGKADPYIKSAEELSLHRITSKQCCQMEYFQNKNPNLGKFWKALQWKMFVFLGPFFSFFRPNGVHTYFTAVW